MTKKIVRSYDSPTAGAGSVVNEVEMAYNGFGQLVTEYQEHSGAVNASTTPKVQYAYADGSDNHIRPASVTYPGGRTITYDYGSASGMDDAASRVQSVKDGTVDLVSYSYLGRQTTVNVDYTEPDLQYTLVDLTGSDDPDTGDIYSGMDRFGRVKDSRWYDYAGSADIDRIKYGYDRAGNRIYREVLMDSSDAHDELYTYDGTHRLSDFDRGSLNAAKDAISSLQLAQQWSLDPTGNWSGFKEDADGDSTWDLDQSRSHNEVNEITGISETAGSAWATPAHDRAGNMTTLPQPADPTQTYSGVWDGWNRLVKLVDDATSNTIQENAYDGRKYRVVRKDYSFGVLDETRHYYYTSDWQAIEERLGSSGDADRQFVWGVRYIDDLVVRDRDTSGSGMLDERLYAVQDGNWNVVAVADEGGNVQERYAYTAYGEPEYLDASYAARTGSSYAWGYLYTGRYLDAVSGIYYFRNRMYHLNLGRFSSRDPIAYEGSEGNLYEFVMSRPVVATDPSGEVLSLICVKVCGKIPIPVLRAACYLSCAALIYKGACKAYRRFGSPCRCWTQVCSFEGTSIVQAPGGGARVGCLYSCRFGIHVELNDKNYGIVGSPPGLRVLKHWCPKDMKKMLRYCPKTDSVHAGCREWDLPEGDW